MQLTRFTDFGLRSLMYLAERPQASCTVREISAHYGISNHHLVKVVHRLAQLGYIASTKGRGGGIRLACDPEHIRLGDLVRQLEPPSGLVECFDPETNGCRAVGSCRLKNQLREAAEAFTAALNRYTLADTVRTGANAPLPTETTFAVESIRRKEDR